MYVSRRQILVRDYYALGSYDDARECLLSDGMDLGKGEKVGKVFRVNSTNSAQRESVHGIDVSGGVLEWGEFGFRAGENVLILFFKGWEGGKVLVGISIIEVVEVVNVVGELGTKGCNVIVMIGDRIENTINCSVEGVTQVVNGTESICFV